MKTITRNMLTDHKKGTLTPFEFQQIDEDHELYVPTFLLKTATQTELDALLQFFTSEDVQDDLADFGVTTCLVKELHENVADYKKTPSPTDTKDFWIC